MPAEDCNALAKTVKEFCALSQAERAKQGENSVKFYEKNFTEEVFFEKLQSSFE